MDTKLKTAIIAALGSLDVDNDEHWTTDGLPRMDTIEDIVKQDLTRADITAAAKAFNRKNTELGKPADKDGTAEGEPSKAEKSTAKAGNDETAEGDRNDQNDEGIKPTPVVQVAEPASMPRTAKDPTPVTVSIEQLETLPADETANTDTDEAGEVDEAEQAAIDLNKKRAALEIARKEFSAAQKRMDAVTLARQDENTALTNAQAIKRYQTSQQEQRLRQAQAANSK